MFFFLSCTLSNLPSYNKLLQSRPAFYRILGDRPGIWRGRYSQNKAFKNSGHFPYKALQPFLSNNRDFLFLQAFFLSSQKPKIHLQPGTHRNQFFFWYFYKRHNFLRFSQKSLRFHHQIFSPPISHLPKENSLKAAKLLASLTHHFKKSCPT